MSALFRLKKNTASECMEIMHVSRQCCRHINKKMDVSPKQHYSITFCVRLKKSKVETIALLKEAFQNETLHDSTIEATKKKPILAYVPYYTILQFLNFFKIFSKFYAKFVQVFLNIFSKIIAIFITYS